jgi:hypothetical protein
VLNDLFASFVLEIDVDIRRLAAIFGYEALEQKIDGLRRDLGDLKALADQRIGGRAASLAQDRRLESAGELDDLVNRQEERRIVELADQP